ncbi:MAG: hypothetical protein QGG71_19870 [Pirellulaceae bacterium]|nr:hypothetical protein [Pirellulaceae bacterium]
MLFELLIIIVLALHLMCMNVAAAGPLVCTWLDWRGGRGDPLADRVGRFLCWNSLALFLIGGGFGLLLAYLRWDDAYHEVFHKFPSKITFGMWELIFSFVLVSGSGVLWCYAPGSKLARGGRILLLFLAGTNLLYHFPFLFAIISRVHSGTFNPPGVVDASMFRGLMMEDSVLPQVVHFSFASFAMVGITMIGFALWCERSWGENETDAAEPVDRESPNHDAENIIVRVADIGEDSQRIVAWGARLALGATLCQIPVGMWFVVKLSPGAQQRVLGGDLVASGLLGVSIVLALGLLHHLSSLALGVPRKKTMTMAMAMVIVLITLMTGVLQRI